MSAAALVNEGVFVLAGSAIGLIVVCEWNFVSNVNSCAGKTFIRVIFERVLN